MQCCGRNVSKFHASCVKLLPKRATQDISALRATYRKLRPAIVARSPTITIIFLIFLIVVLHMIFLIFLIVVLHMIFLMWPLWIWSPQFVWATGLSWVGVNYGYWFIDPHLGTNNHCHQSSQVHKLSVGHHWFIKLDPIFWQKQIWFWAEMFLVETNIATIENSILIVRSQRLSRIKALNCCLKGQKSLGLLLLGTRSKKNYGIIWEFFPNGGPNEL